MFGDVDGYLHQLSRELNFTSFKIYDLSVSHLFQLKQHSILVSVGVSLDKFSCSAYKLPIQCPHYGFESEGGTNHVVIRYLQLGVFGGTLSPPNESFRNFDLFHV